MDSDAVREAAMQQTYLVLEAQDQYRYGDSAEGVRLIDLALVNEPQAAALWKLRGKCLSRLGRHAEAAASHGRGWQVGGPCSEDLIVWQASALVSAGQKDEAVRLLRGYLAEATGPAEVLAEARSGTLAKFETRPGPGQGS